MTNEQPDPPTALQESEETFSQFLSANGYPSRIRWITADQIVIGNGKHHFIRADGAKEGLAEAQLRYEAGLKRGLGILLQSICATSSETIASVYAPTDTTDAEHRRIRLGLKLSCPTELTPASTVDDLLRWRHLQAGFRERFENMREWYDL